MTYRVSMLLKSRASLTCFRACFLPGRAKDLSARRYVVYRDTMFNLGMIFFVLKTKYICMSHQQNIEQYHNMKRENRVTENVTNLK